MSRHNEMPPVPPANRSHKGTGDDAEACRDTSKTKAEVNTAEQGDTANIRQNTTNAGFFKGRRVKWWNLTARAPFMPDDTPGTLIGRGVIVAGDLRRSR